VDGEEVSALPDSENLYSDYNILQQPQSDSEVIDPLIDQSANGNDLNAADAPTLDATGFNDKPAADLNPGYWFAESNDWQDIFHPITVYAVFDLRNGGDNQTIFASESNGDSTIFDLFNGDWRVNGDDSLTGTDNRSINYIAGVWNGADSVLEEFDTDTTTTGDIDSPLDLLNMSIGYDRWSDRRNLDAWFVRCLIYDTDHDEETRNDVYEYLLSVHE